MLKKVISGGQTGADQAALDAAIGIGIPHGGWIPKGRLTESGPAPAKYDLQELPSVSYPQRTEKNIIESDGTLIFSHGSLTAGADLARMLAQSNGKPYLHVDLSGYTDLQNAKRISSWVDRERIEILHITGTRASKDPAIYMAVRKALETFFHVAFIESNLPNPNLFSPLRRVAFEVPTDISDEAAVGKMPPLPRTLQQAVEMLENDLSPKQKKKIARLSEADLVSLRPTLGLYITSKFKLWGNDPLVESCRRFSESADMNPDEASHIILAELWENLQVPGQTDES